MALLRVRKADLRWIEAVAGKGGLDGAVVVMGSGFGEVGTGMG